MKKTWKMYMYESKQLVYFRLVDHQLGTSKKKQHAVMLSLGTESHKQGEIGIISKNICHDHPRK